MRLHLIIGAGPVGSAAAGLVTAAILIASAVTGFRAVVSGRSMP